MANKKANKKEAVPKKALKSSGSKRAIEKKASEKSSAELAAEQKPEVKKKSANLKDKTPKPEKVQKKKEFQPEVHAPQSSTPSEPRPEIPYTPPSEPKPTAGTYGPGEYDTWQDRYMDDRIVLMIRDPYWCFVYWDLSSERQAQVIRELERSSNRTRVVLRVYDVTDLEFDGTNAHRFMDIEITEEANNWYINVWAANRSYCVDLGLRDPEGRFTTLLRSNVVTTPRDSVSPLVDEEWMVVDETFDKLYRTAGADDLGRSSEAITKYMLKRVRADVTSGGLASMGSEGGRPQPPRSEDFWLVVHTELIVYGATEPDAHVTIQGQLLKLNTDGTFSVRYALPDGKQIIPVKAVNAAGTQERTITPIVEKKTE